MSPFQEYQRAASSAWEICPQLLAGPASPSCPGSGFPSSLALDKEVCSLGSGSDNHTGMGLGICPAQQGRDLRTWGLHPLGGSHAEGLFLTSWMSASTTRNFRQNKKAANERKSTCMYTWGTQRWNMSSQARRRQIHGAQTRSKSCEAGPGGAGGLWPASPASLPSLAVWQQ